MSAAKSLATTVVPIEGMLDAYQQVIERTKGGFFRTTVMLAAVGK